MRLPRLIARYGVLPVVVAATVLAALQSIAANAQAPYPNRPIKLVVPFAPGGSNDSIARVLANKLSARLGQPVVVENKGGGGGTIGIDAVAKSAPDGYTLLFGSTSIITNAASGKKLPYDPIKDLQPIGEVGAGPFMIVVGNDFKATTLRGFIDLARAKPDTITYGTAGIGGMNHLATEFFASVAQVKLVHVPYKGIGPAFTDLLGGNVQMVVPSVAGAAPYINSGKLRGLAVTGAQRSALAPNVPTVSEAGLPGFQLEVWWGLEAPARLPEPIVKRLNTELNAVLAAPEVHDLLAREGATPRPGTPQAFGDLIRSELGRWTKLIQERHIQTE
jgi:tripartite-type tricarboxylate transporter receptor subunit TctC